MSETIFSEKQNFKSWWIWLFLFFILALFLYSVFEQIILGNPVGNNPAPDYVLIITGVLILLFFYIFVSMKLLVEVRTDGLYYKFQPFHANWQIIPWQQVAKVYVRKYKPLIEYGGWGLRLGLFGKGRAFSVRGRQGLQLELVNKQRVLFGTQKPQELEQALAKINV